jgi:galactokinase
MTGGGFGGCVIALVPADRVEAVGLAVRSAARAAGYEDPLISQTYAAAGASAT